jgi:thiol-disulfide isomerase/thioredoxin
MTYDLFKNNCNNFTDECAQFLIGEGIPSYITGLPGEFLNTPLGMMLQPMITRVTQGVTQQSHSLFNTNNNPQTNTSNTGNAPSSDLQGESALKVIESIEEFFGVLEEYPAAIVGCFSQRCGPCVTILPVFERLAREYATTRPELKFIKVMVDRAPEIRLNFSVTSYPTFLGFFDGLQVSKFIGAYDTKIKEMVAMLLTKLEQSGKLAAPKGEKFDFELFKPEGDAPFLFTSDNLTLPIGKIQELVEKDKVLSESSMKEAFNVFAQDPKQLMKQFSKEQKTYLLTWLTETLLYFCINDKAIPFLDLLRILCTDAAYTEILVEKAHAENLAKIFSSISQGEDELMGMPKALRLVLLRFMANIAASKQGAKWLESNFEKGARRTIDNGFKCFLNEPAAVTANQMLMMNLLLNLGESKAIEQEASVWLEHLLFLLDKEEDEKTLFAVVNNLCWLAYRAKTIRPTLQKSKEFVKVEKLKTSAKDSNLLKLSKDLEKIVAKE